MDQPQNNYYQPVSTPGGFTPPSGPMVFSSLPTKKSPAKNIILSGILILALAALIFGFGKARSFLTEAESSCTPSNFEEANLTANSIEVRFQTEKVCMTEVAYGTSAEALMLRVQEDAAAINHRIKLSPLLPSTTYYYQVMAENKKVGVVRSFLTMRAQGLQNPAEPPEIVPTIATTSAPAIPTAIPATSTGSTKYTFEDFQKQYGTANAEFDLNKDGIVNSYDWQLFLENPVNR